MKVPHEEVDRLCKAIGNDPTSKQANEVRNTLNRWLGEHKNGTLQMDAETRDMIVRALKEYSSPTAK